MSIRFSYRNYGFGVLRPVINIKLTHNKTTIPYSVLIDSGADFCLFNGQIASLLGIKVEEGEKTQAFGITGDGSPMYIHTITISVGNMSYKTKVGFVNNMINMEYGLVGQNGFFDKFEVKFDRVNQTIELKESKKKIRSLFWSTVSKRI